MLQLFPGTSSDPSALSHSGNSLTAPPREDFCLYICVFPSRLLPLLCIQPWGWATAARFPRSLHARLCLLPLAPSQPAPHTLLSPSLSPHQPRDASSHQQVPPFLLHFGGLLRLSFSFCFRQFVLSPCFCLLPSVPPRYLAGYLKCTGIGIVPRENGTNPTLLGHEQTTGGL